MEEQVRVRRLRTTFAYLISIVMKTFDQERVLNGKYCRGLGWIWKGLCCLHPLLDEVLGYLFVSSLVFVETKEQLLTTGDWLSCKGLGLWGGQLKLVLVQF